MIKDMTLVKRISLLNFFSMLGIIIILTLGLFSLSVMNDNFNQVIEKDAAKAILSKDIKANLLEMHRSEKNVILSLTQEDMRGYNNDFLAAQGEIEKNIVDLTIIIDKENLAKLEAIKTFYGRYSNVYEDIYNLTIKNSNQKAKTLLNVDAINKIEILDTLTDDLALIINNEMLSVVSNSNSNSKVIASKLQALTLISSIESTILKSVRDAGRSILLVDADKIKKVAERSNFSLLQVNRDARKLRAITDKDKNTKIDQIIVALRAYEKVQSEVLNLAIKNTNQKALELSTTKSKGYIAKASELISEIVSYNDKRMNEAKVLSDTRYNEAFSRLLIIFSAVCIFLIYFSVITYKYFNEKLDTVYNKIDIIKTGKFEDDNDASESLDELGMIASALSISIKLLRESDVKSTNQNWVKEGVNTLNQELSTQTDTVEVSHKSIHFLCTYLNAGIGSLYIFDEETETLKQYANYAYVQREEIANKFALGEGTVGQVARQKSPIQLKNIKRTQLVVDTGTTSEPPLNTYTFPLIYQNKLFGVIEIGSSEIFDANAAEFFLLANEIIATALSSSKQSQKVQKLLEETQIKNQDIEKANVQMQEQQQELEEANAQMEEQQQQLEEANAQMEEQQQQLEEANAQMEEQQQQLEEKNLTLEESQLALDKRADDLAMSSKYKSEFLANMSHELRTPLNSIILLSDMLQDDMFGHLDKEEIKKASIIHNSGNELLRLINDVLDLSKVEAGKMDVIVDSFKSSTFNEEIGAQFEHQVEEKNLKFITSDSYKGVIRSDKDRLAQVVRNLISNALKFTKQGTISLDIKNGDNDSIEVSVSDTGIGISNDQLKSIFEAFQQADGGTSRIYGGTGLGLSISKELIHMLGGEIRVISKINEGSTFSIIIPNMKKGTNEDTDVNKHTDVDNHQEIKLAQTNTSIIESIDDDRGLLTAVDKVFLIIEDDRGFAETLRERINKENEYALIALNGKDGLALAKEYDVKGVLLDLGLPDMNGIDVLKEFKMNPSLRKIPVYVISGEERAKQTLEHGAIGYSFKPVARNDISHAIEKINSFNEKKVKDLLLVEDDDTQREALLEFTQSGTVKSTGVSTKEAALKELDKGIYDGIIIDLGLDDGNGYEICEYIKENNIQIPIIIYTGKSLSTEEEQKLRQYTDTIVIKTVASQKRLLEEVDIFMHRVKVKNKGKVQNINDIDLSGTKILVADDDIRNIYVLSEALGSKGAEIITANNGKEAVDTLDEHSDIDVILMDIMMPVMNGYEATKIIKSNASTKHIPIIAVTAKAMAEDQVKALEAGCDDYISKPLKMDISLGIVKSWIS
ncbi:response regulator [Colwellia hornerae]|uniref:histidine kinase n=1 Tax=Colwellia hornerae TaxID=89402 RepID=A0A5C6Q6W3_9GAMM|nr:response regulator [Colwellia hornerae]TWX49263.1 response regulator [Colwellia hornerae]TWX55855.1 response regulator [Colwellia hornerae]TWX64725.1 response regulator [Colwellia hornerae]